MKSVLTVRKRRNATVNLLLGSRPCPIAVALIVFELCTVHQLSPLGQTKLRSKFITWLQQWRSSTDQCRQPNNRNRRRSSADARLLVSSIGRRVMPWIGHRVRSVDSHQALMIPIYSYTRAQMKHAHRSSKRTLLAFRVTKALLRTCSGHHHKITSLPPVQAT